MKKFIIILLLIILCVGGYLYFKQSKTNEPINNMTNNQKSMTTDNKSELETTYNKFIAAVNSGNVEVAGQLMVAPLGDGKTLAERPRDQALKMMGFESFKDLFPPLSDTHFVKIADRNDSSYYIKTRLSDGAAEILINKFTQINGNWTISVTYMNITEAKSESEITEAMVNEALDKAEAKLK